MAVETKPRRYLTGQRASSDHTPQCEVSSCSTSRVLKVVSPQRHSRSPLLKNSVRNDRELGLGSHVRAEVT